MDKPFSIYKCDRGSTTNYEEQTAGIRDRTIYQHDKGDITYSKAFRRLAYKSHLVTKRGVNCRTKLLHSIEVALIASEMAELLGLDVTLTEAISYGHDVGAYPFGYIGEGVIKSKFKSDEWDNGLEHPILSCHILSKENQLKKASNSKRYEKLAGTGCYTEHEDPVAGGNYIVTISDETLDGILLHQPRDFRYTNMPHTLEAQVVRIADNFAYITQELSDAAEVGVELETYRKHRKLSCPPLALSPIVPDDNQSIPNQVYSWSALNRESREFGIEASDVLFDTTGRRLNAMIHWFIGYNNKNIESLIKSDSKFLKKQIPILQYPQGLSFIIDYIWSEIIKKDLHQKKLVKRNYKLASDMVSIVFESLIGSEPDEDRFKEIEPYFQEVIGTDKTMKPEIKHMKLAVAKYISKMTDIDLEKVFNGLWDMF